MGTKKSKSVSTQRHKSISENCLKQYHQELVSIPMRDGFDMPLVLKYDRRHYNETSPWVMFTKGADSCREDTQWKVSDLAYMSRGMVCAYPLLRGTNYFD